jgi:hypothetical protein
MILAMPLVVTSIPHVSVPMMSTDTPSIQVALPCAQLVLTCTGTHDEYRYSIDTGGVREVPDGYPCLNSTGTHHEYWYQSRPDSRVAI